MVYNEVQFWNAYYPIYNTELGISIVYKLEHYINAYYSMVVTVSGIITFSMLDLLV